MEIQARRRTEARQGQQGPTFRRQSFLRTNKVPLDKKLLKNVVSAHGGQVSRFV